MSLQPTIGSPGGTTTLVRPSPRVSFVCLARLCALTWLPSTWRCSTMWSLSFCEVAKVPFLNTAQSTLAALSHLKMADRSSLCPLASRRDCSSTTSHLVSSFWNPLIWLPVAHTVRKPLRGHLRSLDMCDPNTRKLWRSIHAPSAPRHLLVLTYGGDTSRITTAMAWDCAPHARSPSGKTILSSTPRPAFPESHRLGGLFYKAWRLLVRLCLTKRRKTKYGWAQWSSHGSWTLISNCPPLRTFTIMSSRWTMTSS